MTIFRSQIVECPSCGCEFELDFDTGELDEEMVDGSHPITADASCPACEASSTFEYEGWQAATDAG